MSKFRVAFATAVLAGVATVIAFGVASAHSRPVRFDPPASAVLTTSPAKVDIWLTNELRRDPNWTFVHVTDAAGARVDTGADITLSADRRQMTIDLKPNLPPGRYLVNWRGWDDTDQAIYGDC